MSDHPNILWLMTDEQRLDSLGYTGTSWSRTPNLDRVALSGTRFSAAYTPSPVCVAARASISCALPPSCALPSSCQAGRISCAPRPRSVSLPNASPWFSFWVLRCLSASPRRYPPNRSLPSPWGICRSVRVLSDLWQGPASAGRFYPGTLL